jgi:hypothetical protein
MKIIFFLLAAFFGVICVATPIYAGAQPIPTTTLNELQGAWTGTIRFDDSKFGSRDATMSVNSNDVAIGWGTGISGTVTIKDKDITIIATGNQGGNWEFNFQAFSDAGKTILKGTFYVTGIGGKVMSGARRGTASFEKVSSGTNISPTTK